MTIRTKRLAGAVILMIIAFAVYGVKHLSQSQRDDKCMPAYGMPDRSSIIVGLAGDTDERGIYAVANGAAVADLLAKAGLWCGGYRNVDTAAELHNGDCVSINQRVEQNRDINIAVMSAAARFVMDMAMDLNRATEEELQLVPGIGRETAKDIVVIRRQIGGFRSINELKKITVLRGKPLEELKRYFFIKGSV